LNIKDRRRSHPGQCQRRRHRCQPPDHRDRRWRRHNRLRRRRRRLQL